MNDNVIYYDKLRIFRNREQNSRDWHGRKLSVSAATKRCSIELCQYVKCLQQKSCHYGDSVVLNRRHELAWDVLHNKHMNDIEMRIRQGSAVVGSAVFWIVARLLIE
jgi:hypothetical protein